MSDKKPQGIPSPFATHASVVKKSTNNAEIAEQMAEGFARTLGLYVDTGKQPDEMTLSAYLSGFTCTLKALGFKHDDALLLTKITFNRILEKGAGDEPCTCGNCGDK